MGGLVRCMWHAHTAVMCALVLHSAAGNACESDSQQLPIGSPLELLLVVWPSCTAEFVFRTVWLMLFLFWDVLARHSFHLLLSLLDPLLRAACCAEICLLASEFRLGSACVTVARRQWPAIDDPRRR